MGRPIFFLWLKYVPAHATHTFFTKSLEVTRSFWRLTGRSTVTRWPLGGATANYSNMERSLTVIEHPWPALISPLPTLFTIVATSSALPCCALQWWGSEDAKARESCVDFFFFPHFFPRLHWFCLFLIVIIIVIIVFYYFNLFCHVAGCSRIG